MADAHAKPTLPPRLEVRDIGPGFSSTHVWTEDGTHFSDGTIVNNKRPFDSGVLATDEKVKVTRGRLIVVCLDPSDGSGPAVENLTPDKPAITLKRGHSYRLLAVDEVVQYHCVYMEETSTAPSDASTR